MRPVFSVNGTKSSGQIAAPKFQLQVAQYKFGNGSFWTCQRGPIQSFPAPYDPAGSPVRIEIKQTVTVSTHLYVNEKLNLKSGLAS